MCFCDLIDIILPGKFSQSILEKESTFSRTEYDMEIDMSWNTFYQCLFFSNIGLEKYRYFSSFFWLYGKKHIFF